MPHGRHKHKEGQKCAVENCPKLAVVADLCRLCYQAEIRWTRRTPRERHERQKQLAKFQSRMARLTNVPVVRRVK